VWRPSNKEGAPVSWSRYAWRRGSVPLWWGVHMRSNGFGEAEIKIREMETFKGTKRYMQQQTCYILAIAKNKIKGRWRYTLLCCKHI